MSKNCVKCGSLIDEDALFCSECGTKQSITLKKCANCGAELPTGAKFCMNCGAAVDSTDTAKGLQHPTKSSCEFDVEQPDDSTLSFNILGVPFNMKLIEGGIFDDIELSDFYIGESVVTQALWQMVMGKNPSMDISNLNYPVTNIENDAVQAFLGRLKKITGATFAIPTISQFSYVAAKGVPSMTAVDLDTMWNDKAMHEVCGMNPNAFGIYDLRDWPQMVYGTKLDIPNHYCYNPSYQPGECYVRKEQGTDICTYRLENPTGYEDWQLDVICNDFGLRHLENKDLATLRLVLNIPVDPEIERKKKEQEIISRNVHEQACQNEFEYMLYWLNKYNVTQAEYKIRIFCGTPYVDVTGDILIKDRSIDNIPVRFGHISGSFTCDVCKSLKSLCEIVRVDGSIDCKGCTALESLEKLPQHVGGYFDCRGCTALKSLEKLPKHIGDDFDCSGCTNLKKMSGLETVGGDLLIFDTKVNEDDIKASVGGRIWSNHKQ